MNFFKNKKKNEADFYLLNKIIATLGENRSYKITNVSPSFAREIKRFYKGEYFKENRTFFINYNIGKEPTFIDVNRLEPQLAQIIAEKRIRDMYGQE